MARDAFLDYEQLHDGTLMRVEGDSAFTARTLRDARLVS